MSRTTRRITGVAVAGICAAALAAPALAAPTAGPDTSKAPGKTQFPIQILSFNDFHGNLEPPSGSSGKIQTGPTSTDTTVVGGVEYLATHLKQARVGHAEHRHRRRGRHGRRLAAAVRRLPRRADRRGAQHARPRHHGRGQPRVRRGLQGAPAPPERRLHRRRSDGAQQPELLRRRHLHGREVPVPRRQRPREGLRQDDPAALRRQDVQRCQGRLHRHDPQGHAVHRHGVRGRRPRVHRRGQDRQRPRARAQGAGRQRHRRAHPPGRQRPGRPRPTTTPARAAAPSRPTRRSSRSPRVSTRPST